MIVPETSLSFAFRKQESFRDFATFPASFQRITIIETVDLRLISPVEIAFDLDKIPSKLKFGTRISIRIVIIQKKSPIERTMGKDSKGLLGISNLFKAIQSLSKSPSYVYPRRLATKARKRCSILIPERLLTHCGDISPQPPPFEAKNSHF